MKHLALISLLAVTFPSFAWACDEHGAAIQKMTVNEFASLLSTDKVVPVDANGAKTRETWGTIPGSILLTSASRYNVSGELTSDKTRRLVFYCSNSWCGSAEGAAERAFHAGYQNVSVLPVGIAGWKTSGQKTASFVRKL